MGQNDVSFSDINYSIDHCTPPDPTTPQTNPNDHDDASLSNINIDFSTPPDSTNIPKPVLSQNTLPDINENIKEGVLEGENEKGGEEGDEEDEKAGENRDEEVNDENLNEVREIES